MKSEATVRWAGEALRFEGGRAGGPVAVIDADGKIAPSPVTLLLVSIATCSAADVVSIAVKMRIALRSLEVVIDADRADDHPRRLLRAHIGFRIVGGEAGDESRLQHAIDLSHEKYCSVLHSLRSDVEVKTSLTFEPA